MFWQQISSAEELIFGLLYIFVRNHFGHARRMLLFLRNLSSLTNGGSMLWLVSLVLWADLLLPASHIGHKCALVLLVLHIPRHHNTQHVWQRAQLDWWLSAGWEH